MRKFVLIGAILAACSSMTCTAMVESDCRDDSCDGTTAVTTGGGEGGASAPCEFDDTGDLPCDVYRVLRNNCQSCHQDGGIGPFPLMTYADTQAPYGPTFVRWYHMRRAIQPGATPPQMPLMAHPMNPGDIAVLDAWFATCGADTDVDLCERRPVEMGGGGMGGGGGGGGS